MHEVAAPSQETEEEHPITAAYAQDPEPIEDESEAEAADAEAPTTHPLDGWSQAELEAALKSEPSLLGPMSVGRPNGGALVNGVPMPDGDGWKIVDPNHAWGTEETVTSLERCIRKVRETYPDAPPLQVGHISRRTGGPLRPHKSHQSGRDVDVGYYYKDARPWFARATPQNLDAERTWAFVRALIVETDVEMILIDASLQRVLRAHAESIGEDSAWLDRVFRGTPGVEPPLIRHARGHATHIHVRFISPVAQETARRLNATLARLGKAPPAFVMHTAKKGETLGSLARRYGTSVREIQRANGLRSTLIVAKKVYRIPQRGGAVATPVNAPVVVPPRRLPPAQPRAPNELVSTGTASPRMPPTDANLADNAPSAAREAGRPGSNERTPRTRTPAHPAARLAPAAE
jgi:penicillin-insensitive murein endopeptidase